MTISNTALFVTGAGLLYFGGTKRLMKPSVSLESAAAFGGVGLLALATYRVLRARGGVFTGAAVHPGLGPSMAVQEAAWKGQPNAQLMYPWEKIFSQPTVAAGEYDYMVGAADVPASYTQRGPAPDAYGSQGGYPGYGSQGGYPSYGASSGGNRSGGNRSGGNPTRTSTEVRSPTSTSTEVRSPTSTSTEVRSPTSTSTEAFTADNFTATVTGGAGNGATTSVNIYFTPPEHMADDKGHTSHVGVVAPHEEQGYHPGGAPGEQHPQHDQPDYLTGYYPPYYLP